MPSKSLKFLDKKLIYKHFFPRFDNNGRDSNVDMHSFLTRDLMGKICSYYCYSHLLESFLCPQNGQKLQNFPVPYISHMNLDNIQIKARNVHQRTKLS